MQNFNIFKNNHKLEDKHPDYKISGKDGEEFIELGGCWLKEGKNGDKFFSCKLNKPYKDRKGFEIVGLSGEEEKLATQEMTKEQQEIQEISENIPF